MFISPINGREKTDLNFFAAKKLKKQSFLRNKTTFKGTSAGNPLRLLKGITDPYFGGIMITSKALQKEERVLDHKPTLYTAVKSLSKFKSNMQKIEQTIFEKFANIGKSFREAGFNDVLRIWYNDALIKLKIDEFAVLNSMEKLAEDMHPQTAIAVLAKTTKCRQIILDNNPNNRFKRKTILNSLDEITPKDSEMLAFAQLKKCANKLPTSNTNENAFIVKYADRSHNEISKRLIKASVQTIEHVKPDSKGGENSIDNFILASFAANCLRGNMPLSDFIELYPQIINNSQKYINDIIKSIYKKELRGHYTYPYNIAKTLEEESDGLIKLDLSKYIISKSDAIKLDESIKRNKRQ